MQGSAKGARGTKGSGAAQWEETFSTRARAMLVVLFTGCCLNMGATSPSFERAYVRINGVGYIVTEPKEAVLLSPGREDGASFRVVDESTGRAVFQASVGAEHGTWSLLFPYTYRLDLSAVRRPGNYSIQVDGPEKAVSPHFIIGSRKYLYSDLLANAEIFYEAQRDGPDTDPAVLGRQPSHLTDADATVYETPHFDGDSPRFPLQAVETGVDVSGGWSDAGDYEKFVETASYTADVMLLAIRQNPAAFTGRAAELRAEAHYGLDWLEKMWNPTTRTLYYQVGLGDGGSGFDGDHDRWRLPQADDQLKAEPGSGDYYVKYRPVFRAGPPGSPISPNLAGRMAAALALGYQLYHTSEPRFARRCLADAETLFDLARTNHVGTLLTTAPHSFYPEVEWRDDMELGAVELYLAIEHARLPSGLPHTDPTYYLARAAHWASSYMTSPNNGNDSLNLYDVSGLAHYELFRALNRARDTGDLEVTGDDLLEDLREQLARGAAQAATDPFGLGVSYTTADPTPHALGLAVEAHLYDQLTGRPVFAALERSERNWVLGSNAWGSAFIVGASQTFPHFLHHQVANLAGSLTGSNPLLLGATVDGPAAESDCSGVTPCPGMLYSGADDHYASFTGRGARFVDNVAAWPNVEPADDYTALTILLFSEQMAGDLHAAFAKASPENG